MTSASTTSQEFACGACGQANERTNRFCSDCGQTLWEECHSCKSLALIGQRFCNKCGFDLESKINERIVSRVETLQRARVLADEGKLKDAIRIVESITDAPDYRYQETAESATKCLESLKLSYDQWAVRLQELPAEAERLKDKQRYKDLVELLEPVPAALLPDDLAAMLNVARSNARIVSGAKSSLQRALSEKDWPTTINDLVQLLEIFPEKKKYSELLEKVAGKICKAARKAKRNGEHVDALGMLDTIPPQYQPDEVKVERSELEELIFLRKTVTTAPFVSPIIGATIASLLRLTPDDQKIKRLASKYESARSARPAKGFHVYPTWTDCISERFGQPVVPGTLPTSVEGARPACLTKAGARFWIAFGLALQGLGEADPNANFLKSNGNLLGRLTRKKSSAPDVAWGVDIGDRSIKAVRLRRAEDAIRVEDALLVPIDREDELSALRHPSSATVFRILEELLSDPIFGDTGVVTNLPGSDLLSRYIELPLNSPKQHETFIQQEAQANIPINFEQLDTAYLASPPESETSVSQRTVLLALRKSDLDACKAIWKQLKVNLIGLVAEPIAYVNALRHQEYLSELSDSTDAIVLIDVGHARSLIMVVTPSGNWFRSIDWGLDDITATIAQEFKLSRKDADSIRKSIVRKRQTFETVRAMEAACMVPKREIERSLRAAQDHLENFNIKSVLLTGGGAYQPFLSSVLNGEMT